MREVYNGYDEKFINGRELKEMFFKCFLCEGRHHEAVYDLTIPEYLQSLKIKDDEKYRLFINNSFCKIMRSKTDGSIDFFGYTDLGNTCFSNKYLHREQQTCPICNRNMIVKFGKYGPFWSCGNYPKCKGSKKILILGNQSRFGFKPNNLDK